MAWPDARARRAGGRGAERRALRHRAQVEAASRCWRFFCLAVFAPAEIAEWTDGGNTALCPRCGIDAVIPEAAGISLRPAVLQAMRGRWFDGC